jgi:hypothetical protein
VCSVTNNFGTKKPENIEQQAIFFKIFGRFFKISVVFELVFHYFALQITKSLNISDRKTVKIRKTAARLVSRFIK